ncbi:MAG: methylated-DNA--[protein]-cysteine S-methyltransferase [Geminicoccaceae bacterium]|nr:methylated-DNA--[protein]-cysteine S-methyltransferase [Geminicoccaceae bacterium]
MHARAFASTGTEDAAAPARDHREPPIATLTEEEYRAIGADLRLRFGLHPTPFGTALFVASPRGLCRLAFADTGGAAEALARARAEWPLSPLLEDADATADLARRAFAGPAIERGIPLLLKGTPFDLRVWRALLAIPEGEVRSYGAIAAAIGAPGASRAVGRACGRNPIGWLVPCHRVIRADGGLGGYGWGLERKRAMLAYEAARRKNAQLHARG